MSESNDSNPSISAPLSAIMMNCLKRHNQCRQKLVMSKQKKYLRVITIQLGLILHQPVIIEQEGVLETSNEKNQI